MISKTKIRTAIVDDSEDSLLILQDYLNFFPDIDYIGGATKYAKAKKMLLENKPDLLFLDIEMPCKNGFELLHEVRGKGCNNLSVIFYTAYDQYVIKALRESAFDYLLKPFSMDELKGLIDRYVQKKEKDKINKKFQSSSFFKGIPDMVALPTSTGIHFVDKNNIVLFRCVKDESQAKPTWMVMENNRQFYKLRQSITARDILSIIGNDFFVLVNQSAIVNLAYLATIEFKNRACILVPPYDEIDLSVSRSQLSELRARFEVF
jgi:two-component system LytT family response regulator